MVSVLILGGSGLLGKALRRRARPGDALTLTHHRNAVAGSRPYDVRTAFEIPAHGCDVVICSLPLAKTLMETGDGGESARRICASLRGVRSVLLSTDAVFSGRAGNYGESAATDPITGYGVAQAALDHRFLETCPEGLVVRTSFLFGGRPPDVDKRLGPILSGKASVAEQRWPGNIYRSPTEVDFCAEAIWRCIERNRSGVMNICGPRMSIHGFFAAALAHRSDLALPPPISESRSDVAVDTSLDPALMEAELGIERNTGWAWYREDSKSGGRRSGA